MMQTLFSRSSLCRMLSLLSVVVLLSGCANSWSAKVTSFEQWPYATQGQSYTIEPRSSQDNNLEFATIADTVRAAIGGPTGLVEATQPDQARFVVQLRYDTELKQGWTQRYGDPYFDGMGLYGGVWSGYFGPWGGLYYSPRVVTVPVQYPEYRLQVFINDRQRDGAEVYRSQAVTQDNAGDLVQTMANLAQAIFQDFPGNNGVERKVRLETK